MADGVRAGDIVTAWRVLRHAVETDGVACTFTLPLDATVVHVACQDHRPGRVMFWVETPASVLDDGVMSGPVARWTFRAFATGDTIEAGWSYVGTALQRGGLYVWHLYRRRLS